ncbi:MAG: malate synthase [Candidatus Omnitrophota bacterium]
MKFNFLSTEIVSLAIISTFACSNLGSELSFSPEYALRRVRESGQVVINPAVKAKYAELFGDKEINGRKISVEQTIAAVTTALGPEIAQVLNARRQLLASPASVKDKYAWPKWDDKFEDADGNVRTFREIVQGAIDNFLGRDTPLRWRLNDKVPIPDDAHPLKNPGLELTGPWEPLDMAMNQLNADVAVAFEDEEDASPRWYVPFGMPAGTLPAVFQGRQNVKDILEGKWGDGTNPVAYTVVKKGETRTYTIQKPRDQWPTIFHRVAGNHLLDPYITVNGKPAPAMFISHVLHALNNYGSLKKAGDGLYYYEPKIQTPQEALIVEKTLRRLEGLIGLKPGTIKIAMLYEEGNAGRFLVPIAWVLRDRLIKWSDGRWDYLGSLIEMWKDEAVFPDPQTITMTSPNMMAYQRYSGLIMAMVSMKYGQVTNGGKVGGMAAVMLYPQTDPYGRFKNNPKALRAMKMDKLRERLSHLIFVPDEPLNGQQVTLEEVLAGKVKGKLYDFLRQSWVATKDDAYVAAGNTPLRAALADLQAMIDAPIETVTIDGKAVPTVASGLIPPERQLFQTLGLLNENGKIRVWVVTKEQFDSPEKLYTQELWESIYAVPKGDITIEHLQHAFYMAANYGFQILNGNLAAAIDDYELGLRFMNDLATYRIFVAWLWTALHHQAKITKDGYLKSPKLTELGVIPAENAFQVKAGTRFTPELFEKLWNYHNLWTAAFFAEQDRRGEPARFDRSKAPIIMEILKHQLTAPRYIQHSARVLFVLAEANDRERQQLMEAIFSPSREEVIRKIQAGQLDPFVLVVHDYIYDLR